VAQQLKGTEYGYRIYDDAGNIISQLKGEQANAVSSAIDISNKAPKQSREFQNKVDEYVISTQEGRTYSPDLSGFIPIRDETGKVNETMTNNATEYMQEFTSNPSNLAGYKYIDRDGEEVYYQLDSFADDIPKDEDGNLDFDKMNLTFSGITKDINPAFGSPTFELRYYNDNAELKTLHAPVPPEVAYRIMYPGGRKPDDGRIEGNTGWNLKQEGLWKANGLITEAQYQPAKVYPTEYGTFYLENHPKTGKPISSEQQFIFLTEDGQELTGSEFKSYITGSHINEVLNQN